VNYSGFICTTARIDMGIILNSYETYEGIGSSPTAVIGAKKEAAI